MTCIDKVGGGTKHAGRGTYDLNKPKAPGLFPFFLFFKYCVMFSRGVSQSKGWRFRKLRAFGGGACEIPISYIIWARPRCAVCVRWGWKDVMQKIKNIVLEMLDGSASTTCTKLAFKQYVQGLWYA